jgi:two-component sensor histidine kinase
MAAQAFAMALHELATNSAKYGALSVPLGRIGVEWHVTAERKIELRWAETGGPTVAQPDRSGLGTRVIERAVRDQLDGDVGFDWRAEGLVCTLVIPSDSLARVQAVTPARI